MAQTDDVYLLHFEQPYRHARHYVGRTNNLARRLAEHQAGRGARLIEVITRAGIGFVVAKVWSGGGSALERRLKGRHGAARFCPICRGQVEDSKNGAAKAIPFMGDMASPTGGIWPFFAYPP